MPRSRSRVIARPVISTMVSVEDDAHQAGNDVVGGQSLRVETAMYAQFDRWRGCTLQTRQVGANTSMPKRFSTEIAPLAAIGSVASASTSTTGDFPRTRSRLKPGGKVTTNCTSPRSSRPSA